MSIEQILNELIAERDKLDRAIEALHGPLKRRGRPARNPAVPSAAVGTVAAKRKRRTFTAAQRKQQAAKMRAYWAAKRKAQAKPQAKAPTKSKKATKAA
jgi:hypothetical protein